MSQIDRVIHLPILLWFLLFFFGFYLLVYSFFVPLIVSTLGARENHDSLILQGLLSSFTSLVALLPVFSSKVRNWGPWLANSTKILSTLHNL